MVSSNRQSAAPLYARMGGMRSHPVATMLMLALLLAVIGLTAFRIYRSYSEPGTTFDWENRGLSDFHNGTYFPTLAFLNGESPYSGATAEKYGMSRATPPYSPIVFALHAPFAAMPLEFARVACTIYNIGLLGVLAYCGLAMSRHRFVWFDWFAVFTLLLVSRPGHITIFTGYFTTEIALGCIVALHFAHSHKPLAGAGMVLASIKPNFIIPLIIVMLFRKNFVAVGYGLAFCAAATVAAAAWLVAHQGLSQFVTDFVSGQAALHIDPTEMPINTWTRIDLLGMYAKIVDWVPGDVEYLIVMLVTLTLIGPLITFKCGRQTNPGATGLTATIGAIAILISFYHQSYDCLLLVVPAIGLMFFGTSTMPEVPAVARRIVAVLLAVPAVNYLSTKSAMEFLSLPPMSASWQAVTLVNGISLTIALLILLFVPTKNVAAETTKIERSNAI